ncbi:MAG: hypothetical protein N2688_05470 [Burkholderiaceae bacterium]|nr:hypothetical protein [Burkholderiaceae bacterium]
MPRDAALPSGFPPSLCHRPPGTYPVASVEAVMAAVRRAFPAERCDRLPLRARLLDVLEALDTGRVLVLCLASSVPTVWLDGHPDVVLLAGVLFTYGFVEVLGRHRDNADLVYFALSAAGARKLREGRAWWNSLSLWQRVLVRIGG